MHNNYYVLPGGLIDSSGTVHRELELCPLSGREEELLVQTGRSVAEQVSDLLSHCVKRIGDLCPINPELASQLIVADRQYILLMLRQLTFGDQVFSKSLCPWPDCGETIDIDFKISDIPITQCNDLRPSYRFQLMPEDIRLCDRFADRDIPIEVDFRLPNGADQQAVTPLLSKNEAFATTRLLRRCIHRIGDIDMVDDELIQSLPAKARMLIEREMEARAPNLELTMELSCPACKRSFIAPFDMQDFFLGELETTADLLFREVHYLAFHYHWSESEIMQMPREKRRRYINVLSEEIEKVNDRAN